MTSDPRYERYGWDYAHFNPPDERALGWYRRHAAQTGGPVLEVACGSGPLLAALARDGHHVVGLDASHTMLDLARRRLAGLPAESARRVRLVRGDMAGFELGCTFALAIVADNSLREVATIDGVRACLRSIRRHLRPGGRLLVAERRFDPARYPGDVAEWPWSDPLVHPETGALVQRRIRVRIDRPSRRLHGVMTYRSTAADGATTVDELPFESPVLEPDDYLALFDEAGFEAECFPGYGGSPGDGLAAVLCFIAHARPPA